MNKILIKIKPDSIFLHHECEIKSYQNYVQRFIDKCLNLAIPIQQNCDFLCDVTHAIFTIFDSRNYGIMLFNKKQDIYKEDLKMSYIWPFEFFEKWESDIFPILKDLENYKQISSKSNIHQHGNDEGIITITEVKEETFENKNGTFKAGDKIIDPEYGTAVIKTINHEKEICLLEKPFNNTSNVNIFALDSTVSKRIKHFTEPITEPGELNLCELLKDSIGEQFYSPYHGTVYLNKITKNVNGVPVLAIATTKNCSHNYYLDEKGICPDSDGECSIYPSKDNGDWSTYQPPKPKWIPKEGERVWVRKGNGHWKGVYFKEMSGKYYSCTQQNGTELTLYWEECVPFEPTPW